MAQCAGCIYEQQTRSVCDQYMSQNLYTYVGNNPINYIDPTGHNRESIDEQKDKAIEEHLAAYMASLSNRTIVNFDTEGYDNGIYFTQDDAAIAFTKEALPLTDEDGKERVAAIIPITVDVTYDNGSTGTVNMYTYTDIQKGMHHNCIYDTLRLFYKILKDFDQYGSYSIVHTHPYCVHDGQVWPAQNFSGKPGDATVAEDFPGIDKMYLAESETGSVWKYNSGSQKTIYTGLPTITPQEYFWLFKGLH